MPTNQVFRRSGYDPSLDDESLAQSPAELEMIQIRKRLNSMKPRVWAKGELPDTSTYTNPRMKGIIQQRIRQYQANLPAYGGGIPNPATGRVLPTADQQGSINYATDQSLVHRTGQPGEFANASPETRRHMIEARKKIGAATNGVARIAPEAIVPELSMIGGVRVSGPGAQEGLTPEKVSAMSEKATVKRNLREAAARVSPAEGALNREMLRAELREKNANRVRKKMANAYNAQMMQSAPYLEALRIQHQPGAHDNLMNAQAALAQQQANAIQNMNNQGGAQQQTQQPAAGQPGTGQMGTTQIGNGSITRRPMTPYERFWNPFDEPDPNEAETIKQWRAEKLRRFMQQNPNINTPSPPRYGF